MYGWCWALESWATSLRNSTTRWRQWFLPWYWAIALKILSAKRCWYLRVAWASSSPTIWLVRSPPWHSSCFSGRWFLNCVRWRRNAGNLKKGGASPLFCYFIRLSIKWADVFSIPKTDSLAEYPGVYFWSTGTNDDPCSIDANQWLGFGNGNLHGGWYKTGSWSKYRGCGNERVCGLPVLPRSTGRTS